MAAEMLFLGGALALVVVAAAMLIGIVVAFLRGHDWPLASIQIVAFALAGTAIAGAFLLYLKTH